MVRFSDNTKILKHENKVLYANCENGKWLRVSEEVAQIISYYIDNVSQSFCEKVNFEDEEDERFFNSIKEGTLSQLKEKRGRTYELLRADL